MTASEKPTSDAALPNAILAVLAHIVHVTHLLRGQSCSLIADHQAVCRFRLTVAHSERQQSQRRNSSKCEGEFARHDSPPSRLLKKTRPLKLTLEHESDSCAVEKQQERSMRGSDLRTGELFSYVDLEQRVPESHPLRLIR